MGAAAWYKEEILAMLCWIAILGGVLIMMGQHSRSEALFYYFRLEEQVPETHLLRLIDKHISLAGVRSGDTASLHVLEESARKIPGVEAV
jgi:hypothetical protein